VKHQQDGRSGRRCPNSGGPNRRSGAQGHGYFGGTRLGRWPRGPPSIRHCLRIAKVLIENVLENSTLSKVKDPAAVAVHTVELLKLLATDPGYGMKFSLYLEMITAWKKYKTQEHSLFITGPEQKADYFLTDGGERGGTKLLTKK
jgi:hypothetical protein